MNQNRKEIKKWLIDQELSQKEIAIDLGVSEALVSLTIAGRKKNRRVIEALRQRGCPAEFLGSGKGEEAA